MVALAETGPVHFPRPNAPRVQGRTKGALPQASHACLVARGMPILGRARHWRQQRQSGQHGQNSSSPAAVPPAAAQPMPHLAVPPAAALPMLHLAVPPAAALPMPHLAVPPAAVVLIICVADSKLTECQCVISVTDSIVCQMYVGEDRPSIMS